METLKKLLSRKLLGTISAMISIDVPLIIALMETPDLVTQEVLLTAFVLNAGLGGFQVMKQAVIDTKEAVNGLP